jgi:hypothetical protein
MLSTLFSLRKNTHSISDPNPIPKSNSVFGVNEVTLVAIGSGSTTMQQKLPAVLDLMSSKIQRPVPMKKLSLLDVRKKIVRKLCTVCIFFLYYIANKEFFFII